MPPKRARGAKLDPPPSAAELAEIGAKPLVQILKENEHKYASYMGPSHLGDPSAMLAIDREGNVLRAFETIHQVSDDDDKLTKPYRYVPAQLPEARFASIKATACERLSLFLNQELHEETQRPVLTLESATVSKELRGYNIIATDCTFEAPLIDCEVTSTACTFTWLDRCIATLSGCRVKSATICRLDGHSATIDLAIETYIYAREFKIKVGHLVRITGSDNTFGVLLPFGETL